MRSLLDIVEQSLASAELGNAVVCLHFFAWKNTLQGVQQGLRQQAGNVENANGEGGTQSFDFKVDCVNMGRRLQQATRSQILMILEYLFTSIVIDNVTVPWRGETQLSSLST